MKQLFFIILIISSIPILAQDLDEINTDRPDQSEGVYTLSPKKLQFENGFTFAENSFADNLMLRYGLWQGTEVRFSTDISKIKSEKWQVGNLFVSVKQHLLSENEWIPSITLVGYGGYDFRDKTFKPDVCLAFENTLSEQFLLAYNIGTAEKFQNLTTTFQVGYAPLKEVYLFVEYFAVFNTETLPSHNIDTGVLYMLNPKFQIDVAFGRALFSSSADFFVTTGFSYLF
ncbi:transporter [Capnocytophaga sp. H2931]|uniref:transporter n=1 Tax=Capnocytophaga sp. H2931 TaxID=1945657 RepID=UPI000BB1AB7A|nr:transporter [Capnocytophaga sp. H2931]ATA75011.1 phenol degradation protein meta [Capnocytophaga sp. H2931]